MLRSRIGAAAGDNVQRGNVNQVESPVGAGHVHGRGDTGNEDAIIPWAGCGCLEFRNGGNNGSTTGGDGEGDCVNHCWVGRIQIINDIDYRVARNHICLVTGGAVGDSVRSGKSVGTSRYNDCDKNDQQNFKIAKNGLSPFWQIRFSSGLH